MIAYLLKTILCSGLLLVVYLLLLQREKMLRFNRFYLLFSLLFSFVVPLISFSVPAEILPQPSVIAALPNADVFINVAPENTSIVTASPVKTTAFNWWYLVAFIYTAGCSIMLFRFGKNLLHILAAIHKNNVQDYGTAKLVLLGNSTVPHSFFNHIFLNKEAYEIGLIKPEVLCHELSHTQQKHSFDIILIELLIAFCWFNLMLYFYRHAIRLNHEFLADQEVIKRFNDAPAYQHLLLQTATLSAQPFPASSFNYSITQKRFLMMTKKTSLKVVIAKGTIIFSLFAVAVLVFSTRTIAQVKDTPKTKSFTGKQMYASKEDAPGDIVTQFQAIIAKYQLDTIKNRPDFKSTITSSDREQLETLYKKMSREQQQQQLIGFMPHFAFPSKNIPTAVQFEGFKNPKAYGVWIDGKKVGNTILNQYKASDFAHFTVSKLYGAAKAGKVYSYQLNMMTNDHYQKNYDEAIAKKDKSMMYLLWWSKDGKTENHYIISSQ